ncbi:50S ribosomal protein L6 [Govanella unica]|uniref:Large ribosomal subunit protein uL6 n=1 Tax=Govanella unica TaxID=2975056 RepID=A0A9X3TW38_9PROT|nr:50S ribosomal protein L6 [Govania unica]MDA5193070.1 50S ribosomal protein L6 [Govania unica]
MSRIGKKPVPVPQGVTVALNDNNLSVKGPKGELHLALVDEVVISYENNELSVQPKGDSKRARSMWGMQRTLVNNVVTGVTTGFTENLEITGVGYRAAMKGKDLQLSLGFSHEVVFQVPEGITVVVPEPTKITITGIDKQKVGQVAAKVREYRKPEPYKGKGIRYAGEFIFRKEGKKK